MFFVSCGDGSEVFDLAEETFDLVSVPVEEGAEGGDILPVGHRLDAGPGSAFGKLSAHGIGIISPVSEQDLSVTQPAQHVCRAASVMCLPGRDLQDNRQAIGIDKGMGFGGQAAS